MGRLVAVPIQKAMEPKGRFAPVLAEEGTLVRFLVLTVRMGRI